MYQLNSDNVIRYCLDKAFFINIHTNKVISISADAMKYLLNELEKGLIANDLLTDKNGFEKLVLFLTESGILEVILNEI